MSDITVGEVATIIICLGAVIGAVALMITPIARTIKKLENHATRIEKIEKAIFTTDGDMKIPVESEFKSLDNNTKDIKNAVNVLAGTIMILIDSQIGESNSEQLKEAREDLLRKREFV